MGLGWMRSLQCPLKFVLLCRYVVTRLEDKACGSPHVSPTVDVSGGAANFAEDGAWDRFKLLRAVL